MTETADEARRRLVLAALILPVLCAAPVDPPCPPGRRSLKRPMRKRMTRSLAKIRTTKRNLRRGPSMTTTPTRTAT